MFILVDGFLINVPGSFLALQAHAQHLLASFHASHVVMSSARLQCERREMLNEGLLIKGVGGNKMTIGDAALEAASHEAGNVSMVEGLGQGIC